MIDPGALLDVAIEAARAGGGELRSWALRREEIAPETKTGPRDVVTRADRASEAAVLEVRRASRPLDGIVSEEGASAETATGLTWIVDPLDGTTNFLYGLPRWCVSLACENAEGTLVGVTYDPVHDELFAAARGEGATRNGERIRTTHVAALADALIGTGFAYDDGVRARQAAMLAGLLGSVRDVRRPGAPCLDLADVACGRTDGFYEVLAAAWDRAAGMLLVREAGGIARIEDDGHGGDLVIASGTALFPLLRDQLVSAP